MTGAHLCRNPRVVKEAAALSDAGYDVTVLGPSFTSALAEQDRALTGTAGWKHVVTADLWASGPGRFAHRAVRRIGAEAVGRLGAQAPSALGYGLWRTLRLARQLRADLYIGHQELGLWVVDRLAREGCTVGADLEDWYSEDLPPEARRQRPVRLLRRLEQETLARGGHVTTTSVALAGALTRAYGVGSPAVVYNAFAWTDRRAIDGCCRDRRDRARPSLHWVSQTVGAGRGLQTLLQALADVRMPVDVHLRGACSPVEEGRLRARLLEDSGHRLFFHPLVPPGKLLSRIAEHDIGLALETPEPQSRNYTVTNKILHYLLGGLAVVATDTAGQQEVAGIVPDAVRLCRAGDSSSLADALNELVGPPGALMAAKRAALAAAERQFSWERQVPTLLASVETALR